MITAQQLASFNPDQLSTWNEVIKYRNILNTLRTNNGSLVGGGVKPLTNDVDTSGGYLPSWANVGGPQPSIGKAKWYHFRFNNGFEGVNVGLVRDMFLRYSTAPLYVINQLKLEIG